MGSLKCCFQLISEVGPGKGMSFTTGFWSDIFIIQSPTPEGAVALCTLETPAGSESSLKVKFGSWAEQDSIRNIKSNYIILHQLM